MLDHVCVFRRSGLVLWSHTATPLRGLNPVDMLISEVLLQGRAAHTNYSSGPYALRWALDNAHGLVFVAVYKKVLPLTYAQTLIDAVARDFVQRYSQRLSHSTSGKISYGPHYEKLYAAAAGIKPSSSKRRTDVQANHEHTPTEQEMLDSVDTDDAVGTEPDALPDAAAIAAARAKLQAKVVIHVDHSVLCQSHVVACDATTEQP